MSFKGNFKFKTNLKDIMIKLKLTKLRRASREIWLTISDSRFKKEGKSVSRRYSQADN